MNRFLLVCLSSLISVAAAAIGAIRSAFIAAVHFIVDPLAALFAPPQLRLTDSGGFFTIDPALYSGNRHEASVSRRSAARNV